MNPASAPIVAVESRSPVARKVASGFVWMVSQTLAAKVISVLGQIVLARWLLKPADFGVISIALTFAMFAGAIQQLGLREILVQRQRHFDRWANSVFWMSLSIGLVVCVALALAAPLIARAYRQPALFGMLLTIGGSGVLNALATVPSAKLQNEMRFGVLAAVAMGEGIAITVFTIVFAALGLGAACVVLSLFVSAGLRLPIVWMIARPTVRLTLNLRRWKYLISDSTFMFLSGLGMTVVSQGDYVSLGIFRKAEEVGGYYFAFTLSGQLHVLLSVSLVAVLMSALTKLGDDRPRQLRAFLSVSRLLAAVGLPACMFQAALAGPIVRLLFSDKWGFAVPALSILSIGVGFRLATGPARGLLKAQGRFRTYFLFYAIYSACFVAVVAPAAWAGGVLPVAVAASAFMVFFDPILIYLAIRPAGGTIKDVLSIYAAPVVAGAAAVAAAAALVGLLPPIRCGDLIRIVLAGIVSGLAYAAIIRTCAPRLWEDAMGRLRSFLKMDEPSTVVKVAKPEDVVVA